MSNELSIKLNSSLDIQTIEDAQTKEFFEDYNRLLNAEKLVKEVKSRIQGKISNLMEQNIAVKTTLKNGFGTITYSLGTDTIKETFDVERFKNDFPELYEQYVIREYTCTPNRLTITPSKEIKNEQSISGITGNTKEISG